MAVAPTVVTQVVTDTIAEETIGHGTLTALGDSAVTQHGHCWDTTIDPTVTDSESGYWGKTENGVAPNLGQFDSYITGLTPGTGYYIRAYATNTTGTSYGINAATITASTIGRRYWWVESRDFHFWGTDGVEYKNEGVGVTGDSDILTHLIG